MLTGSNPAADVACAHGYLQPTEASDEETDDGIDFAKQGEEGRQQDAQPTDAERLGYAPDSEVESEDRVVTAPAGAKLRRFAGEPADLGELAKEHKNVWQWLVKDAREEASLDPANAYRRSSSLARFIVGTCPSTSAYLEQAVAALEQGKLPARRHTKAPTDPPRPACCHLHLHGGGQEGRHRRERHPRPARAAEAGPAQPGGVKEWEEASESDRPQVTEGRLLLSALPAASHTSTAPASAARSPSGPRREGGAAHRTGLPNGARKFGRA